MDNFRVKDVYLIIKYYVKPLKREFGVSEIFQIVFERSLSFSLRLH